VGTKFANLHIKAIEPRDLEEALQELSNKAGTILATEDQDDVVNIIDRYVYRGTKQNIRSTKVSYYINQGMKWTSVLNDQFSWGTVEEVGQLFSHLVRKPIMTIGFFDEDIFELTLFEEGDIRAKKYFCEEWAKKEYDLDSELIDHKYIEETLELNQIELNKLLEISNPEKAIKELSRMLKFNLWMHSEWISNDEEIKQEYIKKDFEIL